MIELEVASWTHWSPKINLPFGPKQYFWWYPGYGLYLSVKPSEDDTQWLLGNRFLQSFHQVYDYENMRMALSPKGSEPVTDHNVEPKIMAQISSEALISS